MITVREAILVEGRYDKIALSAVVDGLILSSDGFRIFKNPAQLALLRRLAAERGLIVLTDPDGGGLVIRNHIRGTIDPALVKHAYIPALPGRERRKRAAGREGSLGVEGMTREVLEAALRRAGATILGETARRTGGGITKSDLVSLGLSGQRESASRRLALQKNLDLPLHLSANALLEVLNALYTLDELRAAAECLEVPQVP